MSNNRFGKSVKDLKVWLLKNRDFNNPSLGRGRGEKEKQRVIKMLRSYSIP